MGIPLGCVLFRTVRSGPASPSIRRSMQRSCGSRSPHRWRCGAGGASSAACARPARIPSGPVRGVQNVEICLSMADSPTAIAMPGEASGASTTDSVKSGGAVGFSPPKNRGQRIIPPCSPKIRHCCSPGGAPRTMGQRQRPGILRSEDGNDLSGREHVRTGAPIARLKTAH